MECPACYESFNTKEKVPRSFSCGHTFCEKCIILIERHDGKVCPICRKNLGFFKATDLPKNYLVLDHLEKNVLTQGNCKTHPNEIAKHFCINCQMLICSECIIDHSGHQFIKKNDSTFLFREQLDEQIAFSETIKNILKANIEKCGKQILHMETECKSSQIEIDRQIDLLIQGLEIKRDSLKSEFFHLVNSQKKKIEQNKQTFESYFDKLKIISTECTNLQESLPKEPKLSQNINWNSKLEKTKSLLNDIEESIKKTNEPIVLMPKARISLHEVKNTFDQNMTIYCNDDEYGINKKICFFGDKDKVLKFSLQTESWQLIELENQPEIKYYSASVSLPNGEILISGGGKSRKSYIYNEKLNTFRIIAKLNEARKEHAAVRINDNVYVIGGFNMTIKSFLSSTERYDFTENKWGYVEKLNIGRCAFAACSLNNESILVCGGYDGKKRLDSIEIYNPTKNIWSMHMMRLPMALSNMAAFNPYYDKIVILGGGMSQGFYLNVEMLDLRTEHVTELTKFVNGKDLRNKVVYVNKSAYTVGGLNYTCEKLLLEERKWIELPEYQVFNNLDSWCCALSFELPKIVFEKDELKNIEIIHE